MKKLKQLFFACVALCLLAFQSPAKAYGYNRPVDDKTGSKATENSSPGTTLPVNNYIVFLVVVSAAITGKIVMDKVRATRH